MIRLTLFALILFISLPCHARDFPAPGDSHPKRGIVLRKGDSKRFTFSFGKRVPYNPVEQTSPDAEYHFAVSVFGGADEVSIKFENRTRTTIPIGPFLYSYPKGFREKRVLVAPKSSVTLPVEGFTDAFVFCFDVFDETAIKK